MNNFKFFMLFLSSILLRSLSLFLVLVSSNCFCTNFTWNGSISTSFNDTSNWTPHGIPSSTDSITVVSGSNNINLSGNTTVRQIKMNSGTIDLQSYILTANGDCQFVSGTMQNGKIVISGSSTVKFKGTTFNAVVYVNANSVLLNGSVFNDSLTVIKNGSSGDLGKGGNAFYGVTSIENNGSGSLVLSDSLPDTFNSTLEVNNASSGSIYLAHRGTGNIFNGKVTFKGSKIYSNYYGTANFNEDITLDTRSGEVYFGYASGSCTLIDGRTITVSSGGITSGVVYFRNFILQDTSKALALNLTGTSQLYFENGCEIYAATNCSAPIVLLNGAHFYRSATFTNTGTIESTSVGGNFFEGITTIKNNCSTPTVLTTGSIRTDTFANKTILENVSGIVSLNNAYFADSVTLKNQNTSNSAVKFYISYSGNCYFKKPLTIDNNTSGIEFSKSSVNATTTLDTTATFIFKTGFSGNISLKNVITLGNTAHVFDFPSSNSKLILGPGSTFGGNVSFYGQSISLNGTKFNGNAELIKYGNATDTCKGGNEFNGTTTIIDSSSSGNLILAYNSADDFNGNVTFIQKGTNAKLYPAYNYNSTFSGNISIDGSSAINFSRSGKVIFDGSTAQSINNSSSYTPIFGKIAMNKSNNSLTLNTPLTVTDSLLFLKGNINADTTNFISLNNSGKITGASDSSLVNGPFKKIGNSAFVFPVGFNGTNGYHPVEITAPTSTSDSYTAQFIHQGQTLGNSTDTTIDFLNSCEYWKVTRNTGTSKVRVKLNWNYDSCNIINPVYMRIAGWNGSVWKDLSSYSYSGDSLKGSSTSLDSLAAITELTLAQKRCIYFSQEVTKHDVYCKGNNDGVAYAQVHGGHPPIKYQWSNGMGTQPASAAILYPGQFTITTTDAAYCELKDTILINEPEILSLSYSVTPSHCGDSSGVVSLTANGGTGIIKKVYWTNDGSTGFYHEQLASGKYNVLLTDSSGCSVFTEIPVHDDDGPAISVSSLTSLTCFEGSDGAALIEVSGNDPFHYHWSSSDDDTLSEITGKRAGLYSVQVTDENGCISFDTIEITQPDTFQVHVTTENTRCGQGMGRALATVSGGAGDYHYLWSNSGNDYYEIDGLNSGRDSLTVTDDLGCTASTNFEILDIDGITITGNIISHGICFPDSGGTANVIVTNGTAPYSYSWFPQGGNQDTVFNLPPDKYTVTVVDANGCRQQTELIIASPDELKLYFDVTSPSTDSSSDGSISSIVYGGTPPYSYQWSNNSSADAIYGLPLEIDTLKVTDHNGCSVRASTGTGGGHNNSCTKFHSKQLPSTCNTFPLLCSSPCNSVTVNINQFGAIGNGSTNDQCAFESASAFFRSLAPSVSKTLIIPFGTYIVGRQETYNSFYLYGNSVLCFDDIENLTIQGSGTNFSILKFEDCMKYGSFDWPTHPTHRLLQCPPCYSDVDYSHVAFPGIMIRINNGKNIKIKDLTLDGNLDNIKIGGAFPNGVSYDGIFLNASFNVTIENLIAKNFGHDGIYIIFDYCPAGFPPLDKNAILNTDMNCIINNVKCLYNGRNGLSWGGGNGLHIIDSEFNWSGQGKLTLTPASGIDIEYENSNVKNSNGSFNTVNFKYNKFWGMTCNAGEPGPTGATTDYFSQNFTFIKSNFVSSENGINAIPNSRKFDFQRCVFVGQIQKAFYSIWSPYHLGPGGVISPNPNSNTNTKFQLKCSFLEQYLDNAITPAVNKNFAPTIEELCPACTSQCPVPFHLPIIDFEHSMGVIFDDCKIETYFSLRWIRLSAGITIANIPTSTNSWNIIKNCTFHNHGINMCGCDYHLADFFYTNFKKQKSFAFGMKGLNNQPSSPLCSAGTSNFWNDFQFNNSINTQNFEGFIANNSPLSIIPTYDYHDITYQLNNGLLPPKFKDPIVPNKVTDFYSCPLCSESPGGASGTLVSCVNSPRLKRETYPSDEIVLTVSPNPSTEFLLVENTGDKQNIKIINLVGKVEIQNELYYGVQKIDISKLPPGLYLLITENNQSYKFIKM